MLPALAVLESVPFIGAAQQDICAGCTRERGSLLGLAVRVKRRRKLRATECRLGLRDNHASSAVLRDCLGPPHPLVWVRAPLRTQPARTNKSGEKPNGAPQIRSLPRPASPDRRASDAAIPPRPRSGRAARCARLR